MKWKTRYKLWHLFFPLSSILMIIYLVLPIFYLCVAQHKHIHFLAISIVCHIWAVHFGKNERSWAECNATGKSCNGIGFHCVCGLLKYCLPSKNFIVPVYDYIPFFFSFIESNESMNFSDFLVSWGCEFWSISYLHLDFFAPGYNQPNNFWNDSRSPFSNSFAKEIECWYEFTGR